MMETRFFLIKVILLDATNNCINNEKVYFRALVLSNTPTEFSYCFNANKLVKSAASK